MLQKLQNCRESSQVAANISGLIAQTNRSCVRILLFAYILALYHMCVVLNMFIFELANDLFVKLE